MRLTFSAIVICAVLITSDAFQATNFVRPRKERGEISSDDPTDDSLPVRFPGSAGTTFSSVTYEPFKEKPSGNETEIPVKLFLNKDINSNEEFLNLFINSVKPERNESTLARNNPSILFRSNPQSVNSNTVAQMARCEPQVSVVGIEKPTDPSIMYFPSCTKIERCGGCCMHDLLSCQPSEIENVSVQVMKLRYKPGSTGFDNEGTVTVSLEKHNRCECRCRIHEEDCNPLQHYRPNECRCVCNNDYKSQECTGESKFWDPLTCSCICRNTHQCSTGFFFDSVTCSCQPESNSNPGFVFRLPSNRDRPNFRGGPYEVFGNIPPSSKPPLVPTFRRLE